MRYQFVDCRWELGAPARGRELYLAGHVPGASFLDVDSDLSDLSVPAQGRHPLPAAEPFAAAASRAGIGPGVFVVAYGSLGGAERLWWLLRHFGHDDCAVLLGGIDAWRGPLRAGEEEIEPAAFEARERDGDTVSAEELVRRLADPSLVLVDARLGEPLARRAEPGRRPARPDPRRAQRPVGGAAAGAPGGRARRLLRLRHHRLRRAAPGFSRGPGGKALSRLVERLVARAGCRSNGASRRST